MIQINLLPWREEQAVLEKKKLIRRLFLSLFCSACVVLLLHQYNAALIRMQGLRHQILKNEIKALDQQLKRLQGKKQRQERLISGLFLLQKWHNARIVLVHLLDELAKLRSVDLYFTELEKEEEEVRISGYARSNQDINQLMHGIEHNPWMKNPSLSEIRHHSMMPASNQFKLSFRLKA